MFEIFFLGGPWLCSKCMFLFWTVEHMQCCNAYMFETFHIFLFWTCVYLMLCCWKEQQKHNNIAFLLWNHKLCLFVLFIKKTSFEFTSNHTSPLYVWMSEQLDIYSKQNINIITTREHLKSKRNNWTHALCHFDFVDILRNWKLVPRGLACSWDASLLVGC